MNFFVVQDEVTQVNGIILVVDLRDMGMNHVKNFDRNYAKIMGALIQVKMYKIVNFLEFYLSSYTAIPHVAKWIKGSEV